jgi:undecaprenyl-diphosphatase
MSEFLEAVVLGIVQGLTEFLPVSSSGHLEILKYILGDSRTGEQSLLMTVVLHFATACATVYVFRKDIAQLISASLSPKRNEAHHYLAKIILSMIPAVTAGLLLEDAIEAMYNQQLILVGVSLMITAILLMIADRARQTHQEVSYGQALLIGVAQAIAIIPGISRSGATISTSVLLQIDRDQAARFSFLMVVPLIFGKMSKDLLDGVLHWDTSLLALAVGFFAAFFTGVWACLWMIKIVRRAQLKYFGWYCIVAGVVAIILGNWG